MDIVIREAGHADLFNLQGLLTQVGLSAADILTPGTHYWLAMDDTEQPIGVIGFEAGHDAVLLRSVAVKPSLHGQGIGTRLVKHALAAAAAHNYRYVYLFSTDAGTYWQRQNFHEVPVSEVVAALPGAPQVKEYERLGWLPTEVAWRYNSLSLT